MSYDKEVNGNTIGKIVSRDQITEYALKLAKQKKGLKILSLPSNVGKQEQDIYDAMEKKNLPLEMYCIESDNKVYDKFQGILPSDVEYSNVNFEEAIHNLEQNQVKLDFLWFDACGLFKTFVKQFIESVNYNLSQTGMAFFTASVCSRKKGNTYKVQYDYYKSASMPEIQEPTYKDVVKVFRAYLEKRLPDSDLFYELTYKIANGHYFVVFGVSQGNIKVRKKTRHINKAHEAKKANKMGRPRKNQYNLEEAIALVKLGVIYTDIATHYNVSYQTFGRDMQAIFGKQKQGNRKSTISIDDAIHILNNEPKEESMNHKIANQVLKLTQQGQTSAEVAQEIGSTTQSVAGIKASISRGTYGDRKKQELAKAKQRAIVIQMLENGKSNEQIIAKTGVTTRTLGAYKAHVTMANQ